MARCGCSGGTCSCVIQGQGSISVSGAGSATNPYVITGGGSVSVSDSATVNMTIGGSGTVTDPFIISADATLTLDSLTDVNATGGATGYVLAKQADGSFALVAPTTAPTGTINVSNGIQGDGSAGSPLNIKLAPDPGLLVDATGLRTTSAAAWNAFTPTVTGTTANPSFGSGSVMNGRYQQVGKTVRFAISITVGTSPTRGSGSYRFALPVMPRSDMNYVTSALVHPYGEEYWIGQSWIQPSIQRVERVFLATPSGFALSLSSSYPDTLHAGSFIYITGEYEAA